MRPTPLIILAALLAVLLIALSPFITLILILYGVSELIKYYIPTKNKRLVKKEEKPKTNSFQIDFLREM